MSLELTELSDFADGEAVANAVAASFNLNRDEIVDALDLSQELFIPGDETDLEAEANFDIQSWAT